MDSETQTKSYWWAAYPMVGIACIIVFNMAMNTYKAAQNRPHPEGYYQQPSTPAISSERLAKNQEKLFIERENEQDVKRNLHLQSLLQNESEATQKEAAALGIKTGKDRTTALANMRLIRTLRVSSAKTDGPDVSARMGEILDDPVFSDSAIQ